MLCRHCGHDLESQSVSKFCSNCGAKVPDGAGNESDSPWKTASPVSADFLEVTHDLMPGHSEEEQKEVMATLEQETRTSYFRSFITGLVRYQNKSVAYIQQQINDELNKWRKIPINIAITGESGSGKSSFINSLRNLTADDDGAAEVGNTETTTECTKYEHPTHKNLLLWDLPGVGTPKSPWATYPERVEFDKYDFFIILSQSRFSENDLWLAKAVQEKKKKFYFLRTKADDEVKNDRKAHPKSHDANMVIQKIRNDCINQLKKGGIHKPEVFVINSYNQGEFDFEKFQMKLINDAPAFKRDAVILSFPALNPGVIEEKKEILSGRKWKVAILASLGSAIPIPGTGMACEAAFLLSEAKFYCEQLGMDDASVGGIAEMMNLPKSALQEKWHLKVFKILTDVRTLTRYIGSMAVSETAESTLKTFVPIIGSIIAVGVSYPFCVYALHNLLDMCVEEAVRTRSKFTEWLHSESEL